MKRILEIEADVLWRGYACAGKTPYQMQIRKGGRGFETVYNDKLSKEAGGVFTYMTAPTLKALDAQLYETWKGS